MMEKKEEKIKYLFNFSGSIDGIFDHFIIDVRLPIDSDVNIAELIRTIKRQSKAAGYTDVRISFKEAKREIRNRAERIYSYGY